MLLDAYKTILPPPPYTQPSRHTPTPKNIKTNKQAERALATEPATTTATAQQADTEEAEATDQPNEWVAHALAPEGVGGVAQLVAIPLSVGPFPLQWDAVVKSARRVLAVAEAASASAAAAAAAG